MNKPTITKEKIEIHRQNKSGFTKYEGPKEATVERSGKSEHARDTSVRLYDEHTGSLFHYFTD